MSLINEALKRTRDAAYQPVHSSPPTAPEYLAPEAKPPGSSRHVALIATVVGGLALGVVGVIGLHSWDHRAESKTVGTKTHDIADSKNSSPEVIASSKANQTATASTESKTSEDQIVAKVMEKIKAEQPATAEPKFVLQGITFAPDSRDAMINGVTVHEGEEIGGAHVVTIESRAVKLDVNGHETVLRLP